MIERSGLCQIKALNLLFSKNNATPILKAPTVYIYIKTKAAFDIFNQHFK